jgi:hypothetical protein
MYYITINVQYVRYSTGRKIKYFIVIVYRLFESTRKKVGSVYYRDFSPNYFEYWLRGEAQS